MDELTHETKRDNTPPEDYSKSKWVVRTQIIASFLQVLATILIASVGFYFTRTTTAQQEKSQLEMSNQEEQNRKSTTATQLMSAREDAETDFRKTMFQPLIEKILNKKIDLQTRYETFRIFQDNFSDLFNTRSLFDVLNDAAMDYINYPDEKGDKVIEGNEVIHKLKSLARRTNEEQERLIAGKEFTIEKADSGFKWHRTFRDYHQGDKDSAIEEIKVHFFELTDELVKVQLQIVDDGDTIQVNNDSAFEVSYFDSPLSDNTLLPDGDRISLTLENIWAESGKNYAKIKVVHFPADFVTIGYRPSLKRVNSLIDAQ